jgi:hypothetical protein
LCQEEASSNAATLLHRSASFQLFLIQLLNVHVHF